MEEGGKFNPVLLASQQISIRQLLAVSSLLFPVASRNSLSSPINRACCCFLCQETPPPGHALPPLPCQMNRRHSSGGPISAVETERKKLIDPLMHVQVKKNNKEIHVVACEPVVQPWRRGSVLALADTSEWGPPGTGAYCGHCSHREKHRAVRQNGKLEIAHRVWAPSHARHVKRPHGTSPHVGQ